MDEWMTGIVLLDSQKETIKGKDSWNVQKEGRGWRVKGKSGYCVV
jgi:hypothetical protein